MELLDKNGLTEQEFLRQYKEKNYPRPCVTVDMLVFARSSCKTELLMVKRGGHPYLGTWALPGGFLNPDESVEEAARRELKEETHAEGLELEQLGVYSKPHRDPRSWVISCAFVAIGEPSKLHIQADDDAADTRWFEVSINSDGDEDSRILTLKSEDVVLTAHLKVTPAVSQQKRTKRFSLCSSDGIAFDHAQMIADGMTKLNL